MSPQDIDLMRIGLGEYRRSKDGWHLCLMHHYLRGLRIRCELTRKDRSIIRGGLAEARDKMPERLAPYHHMMAELGIAAAAEGDIPLMRHSLARQRRRQDAAGIGWSLYHMRALGIRVRLTQRDIGSMEEARRVCGPLIERAQGLAQLHFLLSALGVGARPTKKESGIMDQYAAERGSLSHEMAYLIYAKVQWCILHTD